jgi:dTDP-4-dehydrorhamnose reductase
LGGAGGAAWIASPQASRNDVKKQKNDMQQSILITGANGQLGRELQELIPLYPQYKFYPTDVDTLNLCKRDAVEMFLRQTPINYIINCAAYTAVDKAEDEVLECYRINTDAVIEMAGAVWGRVPFKNENMKIIHISTDYVFDGTAKRPLRETDKTGSPSVYGRSKIDAEEYLLSRLPENSIIIRTSWLYSSFGNNFVKTMIRLGKEKDSLNVVSDQFGSPTYAADLAKTIMQIIDESEKTKTFQPGIYHYSNEGVCTWYDFCLKIHELAGITTCKVNPVSTAEYPTKAVRPQYSVLDKTKIKKTFHLTIPLWEESLEKCLKNMKI